MPKNVKILVWTMYARIAVKQTDSALKVANCREKTCHQGRNTLVGNTGEK